VKLLSITLPETPRGLRGFPDHIDLTGATPNLPSLYREWTVAVKGPQVRLVSPPGWQRDGNRQGKERWIIEYARERCSLQWSATDGELEEEKRK
jgi:hypothetical protein